MKKCIEISKKISVLITALVLVLLAACAPKEYTPDYSVLDGVFDLTETVLKKAGFEGLENMPSSYLGYGRFSEYSELHSNPLTLPDYSLGLTALAKGLNGDVKSLYTYAENLTKQYGFKEDFTSEADYPVYTDLKKALKAFYLACGSKAEPEDLPKMPKSVSVAVAKFVSAAAYAMELNRGELLKLTESEFNKIMNFDYSLVATNDYSDIAAAYSAYKKIDESKILCSGLVMIKASAELANTLKKAKKVTSNGEAASISTPAGEILLGSTGDDVYDNPRALLILDPAGEDEYNGAVAATASIKNLISVVIDVSGDDKYKSDKSTGASQGSGVLGTGILIDMSGDDSYRAYRLAQGSAIVGTGVLFDVKGDDYYKSYISSQASATYGLAISADMAGDDKYESIAFSQAYAGNRGMAYLVNNGGDDKYRVEPLKKEGFEDFDYELYPGINGNWSQGCGAGQRSYRPEKESGLSGGMAGLIDIGGNDCYDGGIWVQGVGYWSGIGILVDDGGSDVYDSQHYCQASVAHFGIAALIDLGNGNDYHTFTAAATKISGGMAYTFDRGLSMLIDEAGNDIYDIQHLGMGSSLSNYDEKGPLAYDESYAFFIDLLGDDSYKKSWSTEGYGYGKGGFFIDLNGNDQYSNTDRVGNDVLISYIGGVELDVTVNSDETTRALLFWERAKIKHGFIS